MAIRELLENELKAKCIGKTDCFSWYATSVGIAALWTGDKAPIPPPYSVALKQALEIDLDLSREEKEFHQINLGMVLVFHS